MFRYFRFIGDILNFRGMCNRTAYIIKNSSKTLTNQYTLSLPINKWMKSGGQTKVYTYNECIWRCSSWHTRSTCITGRPLNWRIPRVLRHRWGSRIVRWRTSTGLVTDRRFVLWLEQWFHLRIMKPLIVLDGWIVITFRQVPEIDYVGVQLPRRGACETSP